MSTNITRSMTVGVFRTRDQAQRAIADLRTLGFTDDKIGIVAKHEGNGDFGIDNDPTHSRWEEGTAIGAATGAAAGVGLGLAVVAGLMTPVGPLIAGGALMGLLASAGAGATVGTIFGGLIGLGVSEEDASFYDSEIKSGRYLVTVEAGHRTEEVESVFERSGGYNRLTPESIRSGGSDDSTSGPRHRPQGLDVLTATDRPVFP